MRIKKWNGNFTSVPNTWIKDTKLSARAKGVMCFLQSVDGNWTYSIKGLATQFSEGYAAIETAITELKEAGYLVWKQERNSSGVLGKTVVELIETPYPEKPITVKPITGEPITGFNPQQTNNIQTKELTNITNVIGETPVKRNVDIDLMFKEWYSLIGYEITSNIKRNRFACSNLLKKHGKDKLTQLLTGVAIANTDKYAPRVADFVGLQSKQNELIAWGRRRQTSQKGVVKI